MLEAVSSGHACYKRLSPFGVGPCTWSGPVGTGVAKSQGFPWMPWVPSWAQSLLTLNWYLASLLRWWLFQIWIMLILKIIDCFVFNIFCKTHLFPNKPNKQTPSSGRGGALRRRQGYSLQTILKTNPWFQSMLDKWTHYVFKVSINRFSKWPSFKQGRKI